MRCDWCENESVVSKVDWQSKEKSADGAYCKIFGLICAKCIVRKLPEEAQDFILDETVMVAEELHERLSNRARQFEEYLIKLVKATSGVRYGRKG